MTSTIPRVRRSRSRGPRSPPSWSRSGATSQRSRRPCSDSRTGRTASVNDADSRSREPGSRPGRRLGPASGARREDGQHPGADRSALTSSSRRLSVKRRRPEPTAVGKVSSRYSSTRSASTSSSTTDWLPMTTRSVVARLVADPGDQRLVDGAGVRPRRRVDLPVSDHRLVGGVHGLGERVVPVRPEGAEVLPGAPTEQQRSLLEDGPKPELVAGHALWPVTHGPAAEGGLVAAVGVLDDAVESDELDDDEASHGTGPFASSGWSPVLTNRSRRTHRRDG